MRGRLYSIVVCENVVALQQAEMRMVRWVCGVKLKKTDKVIS